MTIGRALSLFFLALLSTLGVIGWLIELSIISEARADVSTNSVTCCQVIDPDDATFACRRDNFNSCGECYSQCEHRLTR